MFLDMQRMTDTVESDQQARDSKPRVRAIGRGSGTELCVSLSGGITVGRCVTVLRVRGRASPPCIIRRAGVILSIYKL
jgi:hypothetical protein